MLLTTSILLTQLKWERCRMRTKCECRRCVNRDAGQSNNSCVPVPVQRMEIKFIEDSNQLMLAGFLFQQDGAPAHTACVTQERLQANCPEIIEKDRWPPNSPDLNLLDHPVWGPCWKGITNCSRSQRRSPS